MRLRILGVLVGVVLVCVCLGTPRGHAFVPTKQEQIVYGLTAFSGEDYLGRYSDLFCPQSEDTIYVLANKANMLLPAYTLVYFWPDQGRFLADRTTLNEPVEGRLVIEKNKSVVAKVEKTEFAFLLPGGAYSSAPELIMGTQARQEYEAYLKREEERQRILSRYQEQLVAYEEAKKVFLESLIEGRASDEVPRAPAVPSELTAAVVTVTEPGEGYPINLAAGRYALYMRTAEGKIIQGSRKQLVAIEPRREGGIGYELIPETRYVRREYTADTNENIFLTEGNRFFLKPFFQEEYNDFMYEKTKDPQNEGSKEQWTWVRIRPLHNIDLKLYGKGNTLAKIDEKQYFVETIPGSTYSYTIVEYQEDKMPHSHFSGFEIALDDASVDTYLIRAFDKDIGGEQSMGERKIVRVHVLSGTMVFAPVVLPLLVGIVALALRRRQTKSG